jgi:hypothetical protein
MQKGDNNDDDDDYDNNKNNIVLDNRFFIKELSTFELEISGTQNRATYTGYHLVLL